MNAQIIFLLLSDILQQVLAIGMTLNSNQIVLVYVIIPFVILSLVIRIIYLKLKKPHSYLNTLSVALYANKIIIVCLAEQQSASILKLQLIMDFLIFLNQKKQIQDLKIIVWMINTLAMVDYLKFEGNFEKNLWKLVCEILLIFLDIIISLEIGKKGKSQIEQKKQIIQQASAEISCERQNNQSILLPIQDQSKQFQSDDVSLLTLNKQQSNQMNQMMYLTQEYYIIFNEVYNIKYTQFEFDHYIIDDNIDIDCNYLFLFLNLTVIYQSKNQLNKTTLIEYIENTNDQLHYYQVFSVQQNKLFNFQNLIFSLSKQTNQTETQYMLHFFQAPYEWNSNEQHNNQLIEVCKSLSHELGTNLNSIQTFSDMGMHDNFVPLPIKQKYFKPILINSEQLTFIVSNLRDFQLLTLNQFNIKLEEFDLIEEMDRVDALFQDAFANKNLEFIKELRCGSTIFYNDKQRFLQVYFQLLQNAVKFTQEGLIKVIIENTQKICEITVIGTGIGLNGNEQRNLNLLLESNKSVRVSSNSVGSGLGLRIANGLVNEMNNKSSNIKYQPLIQGSAFSMNLRNYFLKYSKTISLEIKSNTSSIKQLSAKFYIENSITFKSKKSQIFQSISIFQEIPTIKQQDPPSSQIDFDSMAFDNKVNLPHLSPKFKDGITQFSIKSKCCSRVLVVDDEFFNIQCIKVIMESQYQAICSTAYNGREAIMQILKKLKNPCKICQNNSFQIIFLDINMPIMDGIETVKQIKELQNTRIISKTWCIANTGFCDLETKMKSYDAGMDFYLTKPLDRKLLNEIIITLFPK